MGFTIKWNRLLTYRMIKGANRVRQLNTKYAVSHFFYVHACAAFTAIIF